MKTLDFAFGEALRCDGMIHLIQAKEPLLSALMLRCCCMDRGAHNTICSNYYSINLQLLFIHHYIFYYTTSSMGEHLFMIKLLIIIPCSVIINNNKFNKLLILLLLLLILLGDTTKKSAKREI